MLVSSNNRQAQRCDMQRAGWEVLSVHLPKSLDPLTCLTFPPRGTNAHVCPCTHTCMVPAPRRWLTSGKSQMSSYCSCVHCNALANKVASSVFIILCFQVSTNEKPAFPASTCKMCILAFRPFAVGQRGCRGLYPLFLLLIVYLILR